MFSGSTPGKRYILFRYILFRGPYEGELCDIPRVSQATSRIIDRVFCFPFGLDEECFCPLGVLVGNIVHIFEASQLQVK